MIGWLYIREGMTGNEQIGPFTDPQIAELATARKIGRDTAVAICSRSRSHAAYDDCGTQSGGF